MIPKYQIEAPTREEWEALSPDDKWRCLWYMNSFTAIVRSKAYRDKPLSSLVYQLTRSKEMHDKAQARERRKANLLNTYGIDLASMGAEMTAFVKLVDSVIVEMKQKKQL